MASTARLLRRLHEAGYGVTVNIWAEADEVEVRLWRDGVLVRTGLGRFA